jgi:uroporphyrinogen-III synthase
MPSILLTRPAPAADRFARSLRARFSAEIRIVVSPLLSPKLLAPPVPAGPFAALVFTSETGVAGFRQVSADRGLPAWCVGDRTAAAAREAGFETRSATGDLEALVKAILRAGATGPFLHARGRDTAGSLANSLQSFNITVEEMVVYEQQATPLLPLATALLAEDHLVLAPLFSPRTAALFCAEPAVRMRKAPLMIAALSPAVAAACTAAQAQQTVCAARPDAAAMLDAIASLLATAAQP